MMARRAKQLLAVLAVLAVLAFGARVFAMGWTPSPKAYAFQGIDVSAADGVLDWPVLRGGGVAFVYLTATDGADSRDAMFERNWRDAEAAGIRRGALHVYSLCRLATDQGNNFNTTVPHSEDALPPAVLFDFDKTCSARPDRAVLIGEVERLLTMIEAHIGRPALIKVSRRFDSYYRLSEAIPRPVWSMQDYFPPDYAARPWRMWQANAQRRIDGAPSPLHWDVVAP